MLQENSPFSNLGLFSQQLGREAAERLRSVIEERKEQTLNRITSRIDATWLRSHLSEKDMETIEDKQLPHVRSLVNWFGPMGASLIINLKKLKNNPLE